MVDEDSTGNGTRSHQIDRRDLLLAAGTTITVGLDAAISSKAQAAIGSPGAKIDAHTHFSPPKLR